MLLHCNTVHISTWFICCFPLYKWSEQPGNFATFHCSNSPIHLASLRLSIVLMIPSTWHFWYSPQYNPKNQHGISSTFHYRNAHINLASTLLFIALMPHTHLASLLLSTVLLLTNHHVFLIHTFQSPRKCESNYCLYNKPTPVLPAYVCCSPAPSLRPFFPQCLALETQFTQAPRTQDIFW